MAVDGGSLDSEVDFKKRKDRDFPPGSQTRAKFEHLCCLGCDPRGLLSFLTLAVFNSQWQRSIYDVYGVSQSALVKLPERLEKISRELEAVNLLLGHYVRAHFVENPNLSDQVRSRCRHQATVYQSTPELLRALAIDLRAATARLTKYVGPKRYDTFRHAVVDLLKYVDTCTKSPHYEEVADLLDHLSSAQQKTLQSVAECLAKPRRTGARKKKGATAGKLLTSSDALKALYLRSIKYGFRKIRPDTCKPATA